MAKIEQIKKDLLFTLSAKEASDIRSQISDIQSQIIVLSKQAEILLQKIIDNKIVRNVTVLVETDEELGKIIEYYDGKMISEKTIPKIKAKKEIEVKVPHISNQHDEIPTNSSHHEGETADQEVDLFAPETLDPEFDGFPV